MHHASTKAHRSRRSCDCTVLLLQAASVRAARPRCAAAETALRCRSATAASAGRRAAAWRRRRRARHLAAADGWNLGRRAACCACLEPFPQTSRSLTIAPSARQPWAAQLRLRRQAGVRLLQSRAIRGAPPLGVNAPRSTARRHCALHAPRSRRQRSAARAAARAAATAGGRTGTRPEAHSVRSRGVHEAATRSRACGDACLCACVQPRVKRCVARAYGLRRDRRLDGGADVAVVVVVVVVVVVAGRT